MSKPDSGARRDRPAAATDPTPATSIGRLLHIMARLRDPASGCPWDVEQTFATIAPYTVEEAYEVSDAIARDDLDALRDELGDLLLQVVFHARMAEERGAFAFDDVVAAICDKMVRRHPHVFGGTRIATAAEQTAAWEIHKAAERQRSEAASALDGVAVALPALTRAAKLQKRAALVGFDWSDVQGALDKLAEETDELTAALAASAGEHDINEHQDGKREPVDRGAVEDEIGDLLFSCVNVARKLGFDPEQALRRSSDKFERRFRRMEAELAEDGRRPGDADLEELEALWQRAKTKA